MKPIKSFWTYETGTWSEKENVYINKSISNTKVKELNIEIYEDDHGIKMLKFHGGPTGFETYYFNDLVKENYELQDAFCICGGTINSWARCVVHWKDVLKIINEEEILWWSCKNCGDNEQPLYHKCVREDGKGVTDEIVDSNKRR